jgi:hypothetical protein
MHKLVILMIAVPLYGQANDRMESASLVFETGNALQQPHIECLAPRELFPFLTHHEDCDNARTANRLVESEQPHFTLNSPYRNYANWYMGQMHLHTHDTLNGISIGSPDAKDPASAIISKYRDLGYDFVSITDHSVYTEDPGLKGILFIAGEEVEANLSGIGVHANGFTISNTIGDGTLVENMLATPGILVQLNHPARSGVMKHHIDSSGAGLWAIEVSNWYNKNPRDLLLWDSLIAQGKIIWCNATDDMHSVGDAGHNATIVNSPDLTRKSILANLLTGNFYAAEGGPDFVDMTIRVDERTIICTTTNGSKIRWFKQDCQLVKETSGRKDSYTPMGNEVFVRIEVQMEERDDDGDGVPNTAFSQPIFLQFE